MQQREKATRQHTREHNLQLVLRVIYEHREVSRADLSRLTRLTPTSASEVVSALLERGLIEEIGAGPSSGGRSPLLFRVAENARQLISVSLSGSELVGALLNLRGEIQVRELRPLGHLQLPGRDGAAVLPELYGLIDTLISAARSPLLGIGVSVPGRLDAAGAVVRWSGSLGWQDLPLLELLRSRYSLPIYLAKESHTAALAEYSFGSARSLGDLALVRIDQEISAGILLGGQLFYGAGGQAGEIGHVSVVEQGMPCRCGNQGCLETLAGSGAVLQQARALASADPGSRLHDFAPTIQSITLEELRQAFQAGDPRVRDLIGYIAQHLGRALAGMVGALGLSHVLLTGWVAQFGPPMREAIAREFQRRLLPEAAAATSIDLIVQSPNAPLLGAAAMLIERELDLAPQPQGQPLEPSPQRAPVPVEQG